MKLAKFALSTVLALTITLMFISYAFASAPSQDSSTVSFSIKGGDLSENVIATSDHSIQLVVDDFRGTGSGWNVSLSGISQPVSSVIVACQQDTQCSLPSSIDAYNSSFSAGTGEGMGAIIITLVYAHSLSNESVVLTTSQPF